MLFFIVKSRSRKRVDKLMSKFNFIGWCNEDGHDKIWGTVTLVVDPVLSSNNKYLTFWGRRGAKLQTKIVDGTHWEMMNKVDAKKRKGYVKIDESTLHDLYPEFQKEISKNKMWAILSA